MILYPTETIYALGANVFDPTEMDRLYTLKGRSKEKQVSWLVRDVRDIERYAVVGEIATKIAKRFLPGPLTLVLPLKQEIVEQYGLTDTTVGFRISTDPVAQKVIYEFMEKHGAPLTCTSANVSGMDTKPTVEEILTQFGGHEEMIGTVMDDGPRMGVPTTVVRVVSETVEILREGPILQGELLV